MKKYILLILSFFVMMNVKAEGDMPVVDSYIEDQAYSEGVLVTNTWAYDTTIDMYVKLDETGHIIMTLDNPNNDPTAIKGKINIKAKVNSSFDDKKINIILISDSYRYSFTLDKSNNFEINESINVDSYEITYVHVNDDNEYSIDYPSDINVYDNKVTNITLDYSEYKDTENKKVNNKKEVKKIIVYTVGGILLLFFVILGILFAKARNI
jgi:hypothetical protein